MIAYPVGQSGETLLLHDDVLSRFARYRQTRFWHREAGGQLFARFSERRVDIVEATGPRLTDRRSRYGYLPDRAVEQAEIEARFASGLHFIGDWHTHPERYPTPSGCDSFNISDCFTKSSHRFSAFVLVIVGAADFPAGLHVSVNDAQGQYQLDAMVHPSIAEGIDDARTA